MRTIRRILVAIKDCETRTAPALAKAAQLARALGARLEIFHGICDPLYVDGYGATGADLPELQNNLRARVLEKLEKLATKLREKDIAVSVAAEWDFPVYEAIIRRAELIKADLIVADQHLGKHRAAGLLHLTDWELLRLSPIPVLLVKTAGTYRHPAVLAAVDPAHTFSKPAALDRRILRTSAALARALRGSQHVMHAFAPFPFAADPETMINPVTVEKLKADAEAAAQKLLDRELRTSHIPKAQRHLVGGTAPNAIVATAKEIRSSVVVMGAISRSGLTRLFIGNTAERTLDLLTCDVLVVKPAHFGNKIPRGKRGARVVAYSSTALPL